MKDFSVKDYEEMVVSRWRELSNVYWFSDTYVSDLPKPLKAKFDKVIEEELEGEGIDCVLSRNSIDTIFATFVGKSLDEFAAAYCEDYNDCDFFVFEDFKNYISSVKCDLIDTAGSDTECDCFEVCAYSGEVLSSFGTHKEMVDREIYYISEQGELSQRDFDVLNLFLTNYGIGALRPVFHLLYMAT